MYKKNLFAGLFTTALLLFTMGCKKDKDAATTVLVSTSAVTNIAATSPSDPVSATSGGDVAVVGAESITERGVCWATSSRPTTSDQKAASGSSGAGNFSAELTGLTFGGAYYVRAYVINNGETFYGNEMKFTASAPVELIANADFELPANPDIELVNEIPDWKTDETNAGNIGRGTDCCGRNDTRFIWTYNTSKSFYQVVGGVPALASDYAISFDGNYDWTDWGNFNAEIGVIFSAYSGDDPTTRVAIDTVKIATGDFPGWGNNWTRKTASFSLPAASAYEGQKLVIEFDVLPYIDPATGDEWDNTVWYNFDNISVIQTLK